MFTSARTRALQAVRHFGSTPETLVKTAYYDMHIAMGGKMVPFAGYELPVQVRKAIVFYLQY
jgi:aminomethyltransferase